MEKTDAFGKRIIESPDVVNVEEGNAWTPGIESLLSNMAIDCKKYKKLHSNSAHSASKKHGTAMYLAIALGPISGVVASIGAVMHPEENKLFPILEICLGFLSGIILGSIKVAKFDEKSTTHKIACAKYTSMISNINFQLALPIESRDNPIEFMKWVENKYDELLLQSPLIDDKINISEDIHQLQKSTCLRDVPTDTSLQYELKRLNKI
tara:strand:+ start:77 stop:703 length:627 start_codon:yes stop_codon:yes gene_type:complete